MKCIGWKRFFFDFDYAYNSLTDEFHLRLHITFSKSLYYRGSHCRPCNLVGFGNSCAQRCFELTTCCSKHTWQLNNTAYNTAACGCRNVTNLKVLLLNFLRKIMAKSSFCLCILFTFFFFEHSNYLFCVRFSIKVDWMIIDHWSIRNGIRFHPIF